MNRNRQDVLLSIANNAVLAVFGLIGVAYADIHEMTEATKDVIFFGIISLLVCVIIIYVLLFQETKV